MDVENDPVYKMFIDRGYKHYPPSPYYPNLFSKSFIYHNGMKFYLIWQLREKYVELTMVRNDFWVKWHINYSIFEDTSEMEMTLSSEYNRLKLPPMEIFNEEVDEYLKSMGNKQ
jgi:hypothetical protein